MECSCTSVGAAQPCTRLVMAGPSLSATSSPVALVAELHGALVRLLSEHAQVHFQGLHQAARFYRSRKGLRNPTAKKLCHLDIVAGFLRHITAISSTEFFEQVLAELHHDKPCDMSQTFQPIASLIPAHIQSDTDLSNSEFADSAVRRLFVIEEEEPSCDSPAVPDDEADIDMVPSSAVPAPRRQLRRNLSFHEDVQTPTAVAAVQRDSTILSPSDLRHVLESATANSVALHKERVRAKLATMRPRLNPEDFHQLELEMEAELSAGAQAAEDSVFSLIPPAHASASEPP